MNQTRASRRNLYAKWSMEDFFVDQIRRAEALEENQKDKIMPLLNYLLLEARHAKLFRNQTKINKTWKLAHPMLKKQGFLKDFEQELVLNSNLRYFLSPEISFQD